ncbi:bifunctional serine/threonine-protein kinase/formylglycine-generating enzyme family protein [Cronbergia sp. UHCC 0137]|uniref:bifunctional serine/threonine-protein kinase/formylglycine-generating enzyme family protein n=1 Tax=Cronbergia sp. UHCC 0137 TaxID=3110239 RepID=UPI002B20FD60|nr:bifunctional serine/threonine-protein kinase/formylglycine-generating enzyme family protein [Cronbergia sp. UHCC 0137]MEA5618858.1 bifunctional serine/threonine-protein kinase/formylglycine-generating enzyme family protein [Cronbergia sp. UHCC 0137]
MLSGRYEIIRALGQGGFGTTYLAKDHQKPSKPQCVVKELLPQHLNTLAADFFEKEARILENLGKHPQIPELLAHFQEKQNFYIVQEFIQGQVLENEIIPGKPLSEGYITKLLQDALGVLAFVHQQGVIHRDIKPANLIRRQQDGKVCLIDFGIVKELASQMMNSRGSLQTSMMAGTVGYMSPEQTRGKTVFASDIYALGVTAIQAITGLQPHQIEEDPQTVELVWREQARVSDHLAQVLTKMVRRHYSLRYQNAQEALQALNSSTISSVPPNILPISGNTTLSPTVVVNSSNKQIYFQEAESRVERGQGEFSVIALKMLELKQVQLGLSPAEAKQIREAVLKPYRERERQAQLQRQEQERQRQAQERERENKLKEYEQIFIAAVNQQYPFSQRVVQDLQEFRQYLGLTPADTDAIEKRLLISLTSENLGNGIILEMVSIPGGTFIMGSPENEPERNSNESPQHQVTIKPFLMGKYPVTQAQWKAVASLAKVKIDLNPDPSYFKGGNRPVEKVSWDDAQEFCARLSKKAGKNYRLPSEAEWEYACRAGTTTPFYFGKTITTDQANYNGNYPYNSVKKGVYREQTTDVGKFPPNALQLFDMHGNVWEWCEDVWHENYINAPTDGRAWINGNDYQYRLLRSGSWVGNARSCRSGYRNWYSRDNRYGHVGFRVVAFPRSS